MAFAYKYMSGARVVTGYSIDWATDPVLGIGYCGVNLTTKESKIGQGLPWSQTRGTSSRYIPTTRNQNPTRSTGGLLSSKGLMVETRYEAQWGDYSLLNAGDVYSGGSSLVLPLGSNGFAQYGLMGYTQAFNPNNTADGRYDTVFYNPKSSDIITWVSYDYTAATVNLATVPGSDIICPDFSYSGREFIKGVDFEMEVMNDGEADYDCHMVFGNPHGFPVIPGYFMASASGGTQAIINDDRSVSFRDIINSNVVDEYRISLNRTTDPWTDPKYTHGVVNPIILKNAGGKNLNQYKTNCVFTVDPSCATLANWG